MKISDKLFNQYSNYYDQNSLTNKRALAAIQSVEHVLQASSGHVTNLLDIGAGEGAVLSEFHRRGFSANLFAVEISKSGIDAIRSRKIPTLRAVNQFDGYHIDAENHEYDLGTAIHVLEHVEHERAFLAEIARVCSKTYIEVPLEMTIKLNKSIRISKQYGHINFYNSRTFQNLLETSGLEVLSFQVFSNSLDYERHVSGPLMGTIKYLIRRSFLFILPEIAPYFMTYLAGALCKKREAIESEIGWKG